MNTEFEVCARIIFWGDRLNAADLANELSFNPNFCRLKSKGQEQLRGDGSKTGSFSKTACLSYTYSNEFPESKYNPEKQFEFVEEKLKKLSKTLVDHQVESAELQVFVYYENKSAGDVRVDFMLPEALLLELCKHQIAVRITVLP